MLGDVPVRTRPCDKASRIADTVEQTMSTPESNAHSSKPRSTMIPKADCGGGGDGMSVTARDAHVTDFVASTSDVGRCDDCSTTTSAYGGAFNAVESSISSDDVLMPAIDVCQSCHGGEVASNRVPSTCVTCHDFHMDGLAPMRPIESATNIASTVL